MNKAEAQRIEASGVRPDFWRQFDIVRPEDDLNFPIHMIGCGGIGSPTTLALAKMGCEDITIYDDDMLENHNLPNQIYKVADVGKAKVEALSRVVQEFTRTLPKFKSERITSGHRLEGMVVSGVDSMTARMEIWKAIKYRPAVQMYIDARMGAEVCRIYTIRPVHPEDIAAYEATLYPEEGAQELPCTGRAIIYNVFMIAALVANQVKKVARGEPFNREIVFDLATLSLLVR